MASFHSDSSQNQTLWLWVPDRRSLTLACPGRQRSVLRFLRVTVPCANNKPGETS